MSFTNRKTGPAVLPWLLCLLIFVSGCSNAGKGNKQQANQQGDKLWVAVSIVPQATFVQAVGGERVAVATMIPPGANPENYAPTPQTMAQLSQAKLYFSIGVPAETSGILPRLNQINSQMKVVDLAARVDQVYPAREFSPGEKDPHRWLSPKRVKEMITTIESELVAADPQGEELYRKNAAAYRSQLDKLDADIRSSLSDLAGHSFIVYHPAMGYFADDYGLKMIALEEEGKPATAQSMQAVIDQAKKEGIKVVFYQAEMDSKQAESLARELGGKAELIAPLSPDYIDNLNKTAQTFASSLQ